MSSRNQTAWRSSRRTTSPKVCGSVASSATARHHPLHPHRSRRSRFHFLWHRRGKRTSSRCAVITYSRARRTSRCSAILLGRSEEHTSELQSRGHLVCRLLLEKKNDN